MIRWYTMSLVFAAAATAAAQTPRRLTLAEAEGIALRNRAAIEAASLVAQAAGEQPKQVSAALYPTVSASFTGVGAPENTRLAAGALNNPLILGRVATGFSVNQLLLDFGRTASLTSSARLRAQAEQERVKTTRSQVYLEVDRAYLTALRTEAVLKVARQTLDARRLVFDQVDELAKARLKSGLDVSFASVSLEEARLLVAAAANERQAAYANLVAALGYQDPQEFTLVDEPVHLEPMSVTELVSQALRDRPDVRARSLDAAAADRFTKAEKALRYPAVSAIASAGLLPAHATALRGEYAAAGINLTLPFLNGGLFKSREAEAALRARSVREQVRELEATVARDVRIAVLNVNTASDRLTLTARLLEQATQALELAQARYDLGLSSIVELSQAQLAVTSAAIQSANAKYDYQIQRAVLDFHTGARQ